MTHEISHSGFNSSGNSRPTSIRTIKYDGIHVNSTSSSQYFSSIHKNTLNSPPLTPQTRPNMTEKNCGHHEYEKRKFYRRVFSTILIFLIVILVVVFLIWIILHPQKPHFALQDTTIYAFNVSYPNYLTSNIQVTIASKNPNNLIGVYYQKLDIHASYRTQQITLSTALPTTYQGHNELVLWSPFVYGNMVPVSPYLGAALNQDQMTGVVLVHIKINGKLKWKVGTWMSGDYHIYVSCPAYVSFAAQNAGILVPPPIKYQLVQVCTVDVGLGD